MKITPQNCASTYEYLRAITELFRTLPPSTDITEGATHFHTHEVSPSWAKSPDIKFVRRIGNHLFYRQIPKDKE